MATESHLRHTWSQCVATVLTAVFLEHIPQGDARTTFLCLSAVYLTTTCAQQPLNKLAAVRCAELGPHSIKSVPGCGTLRQYYDSPLRVMFLRMLENRQICLASALS
jgi:hypothetical protein